MHSQTCEKQPSSRPKESDCYANVVAVQKGIIFSSMNLSMTLVCWDLGWSLFAGCCCCSKVGVSTGLTLNKISVLNYFGFTFILNPDFQTDFLEITLIFISAKHLLSSQH